MEKNILTDLVESLPADQSEAALHPLVHGLDQMSIFTASIIGYIGVAVMTYGALHALIAFVTATVYQKGNHHIIRMDLGKHLALGLEFLIGKDIIESVVHPTWDDLGKLGAIIVLRTVITLFLSRELHEVKEEIEVQEEEIKLAKMQRN